MPVVSDGAAGIVKATETCFPRSARQRCLARRMRSGLSRCLSNLSGLGPTPTTGHYFTLNTFVAGSDDFRVFGYGRRIGVRSLMR